MDNQPSLFGARPIARHPFDSIAKEPPHNGTPTSVAAAASVRGNAASLRERVFAWIDARGMYGATMDECEAAFDGWHSTISPRFYELAGKSKGLPVRIVECGRTRPTRRGREAAVYVSKRCVGATP